MLVNPRLVQDSHYDMFYRVLNGGRDRSIVRVRDGVFETGLNGEMVLPHGQQRGYELSYPDVGPHGCSYGVCDNWKQVLEACPELETDPRPFVIFLAEIKKSEQPSSGGWRWHKWGPYIGKHESKYEYLYEEDGIDSVWCYKITQLREDEF